MSPFSGSGVFGGPVSGSVFLLLPSFSFFFPLFSSWGRLGFSSLLPSLCVRRTGPRRGRSVLHHAMFLVSCLSLSCLSARAGLPLPRPFSFSFSLSLSLSSCMLQCRASLSCNWNELAPNMLVSINWRASLVPAAAVIPAPIANFELLRLKCSLFDFCQGQLVRPPGEHAACWNLCCAWLYGTRLSAFTLRKLECYKQAHDFGPRSME